jgi:hypothetical protein
MTQEFPMLVLLRKRLASVAARGPNRFECPLVPVADNRGGSLALSLEGDANDPVYRGKAAEGERADGRPGSPARAPLEVARIDRLSPLAQELHERIGCLEQSHEDSLVPDARAGLTPSDMVTRRLAALLNGSSLAVNSRSRPCG